MNWLKYLFLDFDGVIHEGYRGTFSKLSMLESWLTARSEIAVVISSAWRVENDLKQLRACFSPALHHRIIDVTPELAEQPAVRQKEIELWLRQHGGRALSFAALDDDATLFERGCPWLVLTDSKVALTPEHLARADTLLS